MPFVNTGKETLIATALPGAKRLISTRQSHAPCSLSGTLRNTLPKHSASPHSQIHDGKDQLWLPAACSRNRRMDRTHRTRVTKERQTL